MMLQKNLYLKTRNNFYLFVSEYNDPYYYLALDEHLSKKIFPKNNVPIVFLWRNKNTTVNGKNQVAAFAINLYNHTGSFIGCHILASTASDLISEIAVAMQSEATVFDLAATIHPHPPISEIRHHLTPTPWHTEPHGSDWPWSAFRAVSVHGAHDPT